MPAKFDTTAGKNNTFTKKMGDSVVAFSDAEMELMATGASS